MWNQTAAGNLEGGIFFNLSIVRQGYRIEIPRPAPADCDIYLSLERPCAFGAQGVVFAARANGKLIGTASISYAQKVIVNSQLVPSSCLMHHASPAQANILPTSL